ncbi:hypothetical protein BD310DRAFT_126213 [Dichomitus squalens]|uniref:Uncharacterized protein n=1 Tax=Dichomitus squalens TaxID=114155 RepID=A0A4Q9Q4N8_9APHY|nr:hypothetical protein BD310DRAFT_126213 [Dichomitus squalens]
MSARSVQATSLAPPLSSLGIPTFTSMASAETRRSSALLFSVYFRRAFLTSVNFFEVLLSLSPARHRVVAFCHLVPRGWPL